MNLAGWFLTICMVAAVTLPIRDWSTNHPMALAPRAIYSSLSRIGWGLILSWIIVSCYYGYGGPINAFLSWKGWLPLGRVTYSAYLIHLMVAIHFMGFSQIGLVFSGQIQAICVFTVPVVTLTYILAIPYSSMFEVPFAKVPPMESL
jgi:peptidoglycan/LPS O-acetylase OafA/YrhL